MNTVRLLSKGTVMVWPRPRVDFGDAERTAHADAVGRFRASNAEQTRRYQPTA
jgi:hypothetical protein